MGFLFKRQAIAGDYSDDEDYYDDNSWWYSSNASAIKWSIVSAIFLIALLWFIGGYLHAQRRIRRGLPPLAYHRWILPRSQRAQFSNQSRFPNHQQQNMYGDGCYMHAYPPPAYNPAQAPPPMYQPSEGSSKINPSQNWAAPPPGPPPAGEPSNTAQRPQAFPSGHQTIAPQLNADDRAELPPRPTKSSFFKKLSAIR